jgi:hypothetical protein
MGRNSYCRDALRTAIIIFTFGGACRGDEFSLSQFLSQYAEARRPVLAALRHVRLAGTGKSEEPDNTFETDVEFARDDEYYKVFATNNTGNYVGRRYVFVASPKLSYTLTARSNHDEYVVMFLGRDDIAYRMQRDRIELEAAGLLASDHYLDVPLADFFTHKLVSITKVTRETVDGKDVIRVGFRVTKDAEAAAQWGPRPIEGWVLLSPKHNWGIQSYEVRTPMKDANQFFLRRRKVEYNAPTQGIAFPRLVTSETFDNAGRRLKRGSLEVKQVDLTSPSPYEFTPAAHGLPDDIDLGPRQKLPSIFYIALLNAAVALVLIMVMRRSRRRRRSATASETPPVVPE